MKFRALIYDTDYMKEFLNLVLTISKVTKECTLRIKPDGIYFIVNEESQTTPLLWCKIPKDIYFTDYVMYGIDDDHNEILMKFTPASLARALVPVKNNVKYVKLKLTNKDYPCLTVDIDMPLVNTLESNNALHDIPIVFVPVREWEEFDVPVLPNFHITTVMPSLRSIKNLVDKLKSLAPYMTVCATGSGELSLVVETDVVTVASHYRNLIVESADESRPIQADEDIEVSCRSDLKRFGSFFSSIQFQNCPMLCSIIQDHAIKIMIRIRGEDIVLNCVIPSISI